MSDLTDRAKAALEGVDPYRPWEAESYEDGTYVYGADSALAKTYRPQIADFIIAAAELLPELVAEIERLEDTATYDGAVINRMQVQRNASYQEAEHWRSVASNDRMVAADAIAERDQANNRADFAAAVTRRHRHRHDRLLDQLARYAEHFDHEAAKEIGGGAGTAYEDAANELRDLLEDK